MAGPVLTCPNAKYAAGMVIWCKYTNDACAHQYYKKCKGWYVESKGAKTCPGREIRGCGEGQGNAAVADNTDAIPNKGSGKRKSAH